MSRNQNKFVDTGMSIKDVYYCTLWLFSKAAALALLVLYPVLAPILKKSALRRDIKGLFKFNPYEYLKQRYKKR